MTTRAMILGCSGPVLTSDERDFFRRVKPWGFILFKRNIETPEQVSALTREMRALVGREDAPILIDQEGGRVQRMGPPHWPSYPPGRAYLTASDEPATRRALCRSAARLIARDLLAVGINVDCIPVLDVPVPGAHDVIGDRAYGDDAATVTELGRAAADGLLDEGVLPVIKHMPGHGRAGVDSHLRLPVVDASLEDLERQDFAPFRAMADLPLAMTAHVVYTALDPVHPATTSRTVIEGIIRGFIGFDGLLMSDDIGMKALSGDFAERTQALFAAGCDMALHCGGNMAEMEAVVSRTPVLAGDALRRAEAALTRLRPSATLVAANESFDPVDARAKLAASLALSA